MLSKLKTNRKNVCPIVGPSRELPLAQLPTSKDILKKVNLLGERCLGDVDEEAVLSQIMSDVKSINLKICTNIPLMPDKAMKTKLVRLLKEYKDLKRNHLTKKKRTNFTSKLDTIVDVIKCKCPIWLCSEMGCVGCDMKAHIKCKCPKEDQISLIELHFVWDQRLRDSGRSSSYQIQNVDPTGTAALREQIRKQAKKGTRSAAAHCSTFASDIQGDSTDDSSSIVSSDTSSFGDVVADVPELSMPKTYQVLDWLGQKKIFENTVRESERYGVSIRATAAICTALLVDLGIVTEDDTSQIIDKNKIQRDKEYLRNKNVNCNSTAVCPALIQGVFFDGRKDQTLVPRPGSSGKHLAKEEHYSVVKQPGGRYLTHFTPQSGQSKDIQQSLSAALKEKNRLSSLKFIGCDSTNVNVGRHGGVIALLEKHLDHRLVWLICMLHTNELPFRHLFIKLDGDTTGDRSFKGPIGQLCKSAEYLPIDINFQPIENAPPIRELPQEIVHDLSDDQRYLYDVCAAIRNGSVPARLESIKIGPLNHARWLTLASRVCRLYVSEHGLVGNVKANLEALTYFIVTNYAPLWFDIKCEPLYKDAPAHIFQAIQLFKLLPKASQDIIRPYLERNAYSAHSENLILAMVADPDPIMREKAVEIIRNIRGDSTFGDDRVRQFCVPKLNFDAKDYSDLIDWSQPHHTEPLVTADMGYFSIKKIRKQRLFFGKFDNHTQSIERAVKLVTESSKLVLGHHRREGQILSKLNSRAIHPTSESKKDFISFVHQSGSYDGATIDE